MCPSRRADHGFLEQQVEKVDKKMKDLIDMENELLLHAEVLDDLKQKVARGEPTVGLNTIFTRGLRDTNLCVLLSSM